MKNMKLKNRILIPFLILNLLVLSVSFIILFEDITIKKNEAYEAKNINLTDISTNHIADKLLTIQNAQSVIVNDSDIYKIIQNSDNIMSLENQRSLEKQLIKYNMIKDIYNIRIFLDSEPSKSSNKIFPLNKFSDLVTDVDQNHSSQLFWVPTYRLKHQIINSQYIISLVRPIYIDAEFKGYLVLDMLEKTVFEVLENLGSFKHEKPQIVTNQGTVISSFNKYSISHPSDRFIKMKSNFDNSNKNKMYDFETTETITYINKIGELDWYLMIDFDKNEVKLQNQQLRTLMIILYIISTFFVVFISEKIAAIVTKRIQELNLVTNQFIQNNFSNFEEINISYNDEIGALQKSVNIMMKNIDIFVNEKFENELALKDSELKVLQAQINPHFLYNILDMINWMALDQKAYDISKATSSLAKFFRLSLADGSDEVTLQEELEHVKLYLTIQNMRYKNRIKYNFDIDENILEYKVLKLILQPLVENAIIHGINETNNQCGTIEIEAYEDFDSIVIEVKDDGIGIDPTTRHNLTHSNYNLGFGVKNINQRIKIKYGKVYGLNYLARKPRGTTVIVKLPIIEYK